LGEACFVPYGALFKSWKPYGISAASSLIDEYNLKSYGISMRLTDDTERLNESTKFLNSNYSAILFSAPKPYGVLILLILRD
jgi:hypothetical protein